MSTATIEIDDHTVEIGNADKVLFPDAGFTKADLADYYARIADDMLPHLEGRPVTMQRFPDGIAETGFYEKKAPEHFPDWIRRVSVEVEGTGETQPQVVCDNAATLVYLADQACITPHVWLSRADALRHPDRMIFDLDPPSDEFGPVRFAARALRDVLETVGLFPFVMTTGSQGAHVVVPFDGSASFDVVRAVARDLATILAERHPDRLTTAVRKKKREGRIFLDYLRNSYGQNSVAPYAVRALPGAPVATPLDWNELGGALHAQTYTVDNLFRRMGQKADPWADLQNKARPLEDARKCLDEFETEP
ncbi:ATP-dependent DNA ligase [Salinibacter sp. 10B]|uniref:non-homologous end-joining DNA ligase n=1 Tax=Salinibacter sp. 10B TaxID=1923971 RepID=UPI000CF3D289|nr:non-homologous end-joining DNA ligase [Salinibacter sp. 10B]PQJ35228.1 ATP-dependent DNA ligase [Salinibacter sp. 10B]